MSKKPKWLKNGRSFIWFIFITICLGLGSFFFQNEAYPTQSLPISGLVILLLGVVGLWLAQIPTTTQEQKNVITEASWWHEKWQSYGHTISFCFAWAGTGYLLYQIPRQYLPTDSFLSLFLIWILAFLLFTYAVVGSEKRQQWVSHIKNIWHTHKNECLWVFGVTLITFGLRVWRLSTIPFTLAGDEASQGLEALRVLSGDIRNPFATGWLGVPTMSFFFNSLTIDWFGRTVFALRIPWVFIGTLTIPFAYGLVRHLQGVWLARLTAVLLATYHYHIHFSRLGSNQIADPFFLVVALFFLYRGLDKKSELDWVLSGAVAGVAFYFYAGARLTAVVLLASIVYVFLCQPKLFWQQHKFNLLRLLGAFIIVVAPMWQYAVRFPGEFNARVNQVGIIQSGWLEREIIIRGDNVFEILWDQFLRAFLAFNYYPDRTVWYGLPEPLLNPLFGVLFLLGLFYATLRLVGSQADQRSAPMVAWWWGGMLLGGMMTESPPSSQRLITLAVPTCYLLAISLKQLSILLQESIRGARWQVLSGTAVGLFALVSLQTYFFEYTPRQIYGGSNAEFATTIIPKLQERTRNHQIYFVGAPYMYWGFATFPYLYPEGKAIDLHEPIEQVNSDWVVPEREELFVFVPQRQQEFAIIKEAFPDGQTDMIYSPIDGRLMGILYIIPAQ